MYIYLFIYLYKQLALFFLLNKNNKIFNGCGKIVNYAEPKEAKDCEDGSEICCFISLKIDDNNTKKFCFPCSFS